MRIFLRAIAALSFVLIVTLGALAACADQFSPMASSARRTSARAYRFQQLHRAGGLLQAAERAARRAVF